MYRCRFCLCRSCINTCSDCGECSVSVKSCERYRGFEQLSLFEPEKPAGSMKVLVACEESQRVCIEFRQLGHEAYSCDIEPCSGGHEEWHIQDDVLKYINGHMSYCGHNVYKAPFPLFKTQDGNYHTVPQKWDMIIAFPPCTYMTNAGAVRMRVKGEIVKERYQKVMEAKTFFMKIMNADCGKIAIENPTPMKLIGLPPYTQAIQPYEFGHPYSKRTCLWLKGLPKLEPTEILEYHEPYVNGGCKDTHGNYRRFQGRKERDPKVRAKTFPGIAKAMAEQWGGQAENRKKLIRDYTWEDYGISKARYRELRDMCRSGKYDALVRSVAHRAAPDIEHYIFLSVVKNKSYRALEAKWDLGEISRMPYNHNDFYGYRRLFYYLFDERIRENGEINIC